MALDSRIVLLIGAETAVVDESSYARTLTSVGNAARTTAQAKYGTASLTFDGAGDRITAPLSGDFGFGAGDFTVEGWFRFVTKTDSQALLGWWGLATSSDSWFFYILGGALVFRGCAGAVTHDVSVAWVPTLGQWYHLAVDRSGSTVRIYRDGVVVATDAAFTYTLNNGNDPFSIGAIGANNSFPAFDFNGQMDEVRVTKGLAQYAGAFTPPTGPFPRDTAAVGRVTQDVVEILSWPILPASRATQSVVEVLAGSVSSLAEGRVTQDVVEVLGTLAPLVTLPIELRTTAADVGITGPVDTTGCSLLVIGVPCLAGTSPSVNDSFGNAYVPLTAWGSPGNARLQFFYCLNGVVGPAHRFGAAPVSLPLIAFAFTNVEAYQTETGTGYGGTPTSPKATGAVTPARDGALVLTGLGSPVNGQFTDTVTPAGFSVTQGVIEVFAWAFLEPVGGPDVVSPPNFTAGSVVVVDGITYTLKTALDASLGTVLIGGTFADSLAHLGQVISTGGDGVVGASGTPPNPQATAALVNTNTLKAVARLSGTSGNSIAVSTTFAPAHWFWEGGIEYSTLHGAPDTLTGSIGWYVQPVAASINPVWSWIHAPTDVALTTAVFLPRIGYWVTPTRVTQALIELLQQSPPPLDTRVTQAVIELLEGAPPGTVRLTQLALDVFSPRMVGSRTTQAAVEVFLVVPPCTVGAFPVDDVEGPTDPVCVNGTLVDPVS